jgi:hypothetical protein
VTGSDAPARTPSRSFPKPTASQSMQLRWRRFQRSTVFAVSLAAVAALVLGVAIGRATATAEDPGTAAAAVRNVVGLAVDADALWTAGASSLPPVSSQLQELRRTADPGTVLPHVDAWLEAYDTVLLRIVGVDVPPAGRPIQRQYVLSVTLNRDAVELLGAAAAVEDPALQRELTSEALRLRMRAEEAAQTAQASLADLEGRATGGVSGPRELPGLAELR